MKGNALIGQSGGPTPVINASLAGVLSAAQEARDIDRILGMRFAIEGFMEGETVDLTNASRRFIESLATTPSSILGSCRKKVTDDDLPEIARRLKELEVRYFFLIGGNDTMDTVQRVEEYCRRSGYELYGIGIPKTVDNDLYGTDHTPGYPSAARYVALSVMQSGRLAKDMQRVDKFVIHQTVGRDSGWLAASAACARKAPGDAPHIIYIPERPLDRERVAADARDAVERYGYASIVCGEGIIWEDGTPVTGSATTDGFANIEFGAMAGASAAMVLHGIISRETGFRGEFQVTESLPMCASDRISPVDIAEAMGVGRRAVELAAGGSSGLMVTIERTSAGPYASSFGSIDLREAAVKAKSMPDEFIAPDGRDVTPAFIEYVSPLVGELPAFAELSDIEKETV